MDNPTYQFCSDWATHTSVGKENVKDCWNGQDPEERTCMLKSMSRGSLEFVRCFRNCSFKSFDTPISCKQTRYGMISKVSHLLLPKTLLNGTCLQKQCLIEGYHVLKGNFYVWNWDKWWTLPLFTEEIQNSNQAISTSLLRLLKLLRCIFVLC